MSEGVAMAMVEDPHQAGVHPPQDSYHSSCMKGIRGWNRGRPKCTKENPDNARACGGQGLQLQWLA